MILWDRFCVVERSSDRVVPITDLERVLGRAPGHLLELHLLEIPPDAEGRARLRRAIAIETRTQQRVYATIETGAHLALVCEPVSGRGLEQGPSLIGPSGVVRGNADIDSRKLLLLATELSALLTRLHASEIYGVSFSVESVRIDSGRLTVAGFEHLLASAPDPHGDIIHLVELLDEIGGKMADPFLRPEPESARELWQRVRALAGQGSEEELELPVEPPFVGRQAVLNELLEGLSQARIARSSALIVRGNRGVGKSRLLREFVTARLEADDAFVLTGTWQPRSADTRGGLLGALEQLARVLRNLEPEERENALHRINRATRNLGALVARSAPALGSVLRIMDDLPQVELSGDFSRHTAVIADLLRSVGTQQRPLIVVLDNLETADSRSLAVLKLLVQPRPAHHTFVVAGLRDEHHSYTPDFEAEIFDLQPLTVDEIGRLLAQTLLGRIEEPEMLAETLLSVSGGYPLAVWANLRAWIERGLLVHEVDVAVWRTRKSLRDEIDHEPDIRDLFGFRLAGADLQVRTLCLRMAVLGMEVNIARIRELTDGEGLDIDAAIEDLVERGILTRTSAGVRFPHDSIRELVLESVDAAQRRDAHQRAAALLSTSDAPVAHIAYHRDLGFDHDNATPEDFDKLSTLHVDAGRDRLEVYDLERARWHLERALEHSRDPDQRNLAAEALADVCLLSGDTDTAVSLYTALIAVAPPLHVMRVASRAAHYLLFKSAASDGQQIGDMALEAVGEPNPKSLFGKIGSILHSLLWAAFRPPPHTPELRDALCSAYPAMIAIVGASDPLMIMVYLMRARWMAKGLRTAAAATVLSFEGAVRATLGHYEAADALFTHAMQVATEVQDSWSRGVTAHNWAHTSLISTNRYEEAQDMLDDALAYFRETGDMSVALLSISFKALFGRDREHSDTVLGWLDEGISMAHRHDKSDSLPSLKSIRLVILARQGRTDIIVQMHALAEAVVNPALPVFDRIITATQLALAALEFGERKFAYEQIIAGGNLLGDLPGLPEYLLEIHYATALVVLGRQLPSRSERRLMRKAMRRLKRAAKLFSRFRVLYDLVMLKQAISNRKNNEIRTLAANLVGDFESHGNIYAAREAHRALSQILKAENVLAAAEHERIARNLGRRLGLGELALTSEFTEAMELEMLGSERSSAGMLEPEHSLPAAGMLEPEHFESSSSSIFFSDFDVAGDHDEILKTWVHSGREVIDTLLGEVIGPVQEAISTSVPQAHFEIRCSNSKMTVPVAASDLQILLINLILSARDAVGRDCHLLAELEIEDLEHSSEFNKTPGRYLTILVRAQGQSSQASAPVLASFASCEGMLKGMGGELSATVERGRVNLNGRIPFETKYVPKKEGKVAKILIVHPEASIRETIGASLAELNTEASAYDPESFEAGQLEGTQVLLADARTLRRLQVLEPLISTRLVEIVRRGTDSHRPDQSTLRFPFALSELRALLQEEDSSSPA